MIDARTARSRGITVFEAIVATAALAIVGVGLFAWFSPESKRAQAEDAIKTASAIGEAVGAWQAENGQECPTITQLQHERYLSRNALAEDPWGNRFRIVCDGKITVVTSPGKDHEQSTKDDIEVPIS